MELILLSLLSFLGLFLFKNKTGQIFLDIPNQRSMHKTPVKRAGGLVFTSFFLLGLFYFYKQNFLNSESFEFLASGVGFFLFIGFLDDLWSLSFKWKAILEILFLGSLLYFFKQFHEFKLFLFSVPYPWSLVCLVLYIFFTVNLCNFMDGLDLYLAGSFVLFVANLYSSDFNFSGSYLKALFIFLACVLPFLYFNFPNAKMFMGDSGSLPLGFMIAVFPLFIEGEFQAEVSLAPLMLPMFWVDGVYTILVRLKRKQNIFLAHKEHLYQRVQVQILTKNQTILTFLYFNFLPSFLFVIHSFGIIKKFWIVYLFIFLISHVVYFYLYFLVRKTLHTQENV